ncbi:hypothetical protein J1614_008319 [Plenodomus biglobosus]|nr:hypothetical protein J1614_008319 [Plenodomus biglobosus]
MLESRMGFRSAKSLHSNKNALMKYASLQVTTLCPYNKVYVHFMASMKSARSNTRQSQKPADPFHFPGTLKIRYALLALQIFNYLRDDHPRHVKFKESLIKKGALNTTSGKGQQHNDPSIDNSKGTKKTPTSAKPRQATHRTELPAEAEILAKTRDRPHTPTPSPPSARACYSSNTLTPNDSQPLSRIQKCEAWMRIRAVSCRPYPAKQAASSNIPTPKKSGVAKSVRFGPVTVHDCEYECTSDEVGDEVTVKSSTPDVGKDSQGNGEEQELWGPTPVNEQESKHELWGPTKDTDGMMG